MKNKSAVFLFLLIMITENAKAIEKTKGAESAPCREKIATCKAMWQKLDREKGKDAQNDQENCRHCHEACQGAQNSCKTESLDLLNAANAYHLGCEGSCPKK